MRKKAKSLQLVPHVEGPSACTRFPTKLHRPLPHREGQLHFASLHRRHTTFRSDSTGTHQRHHQPSNRLDPQGQRRGARLSWNPNRPRSQHKTTIILTQPGLIDQILADRNLTGTKEEATPNFTPAAGVLHPDKGGANRERAWNYQHPA